MYADAILKAIAAGLVTAFLIALVYALKTISKGVDKIRAVKLARNDELTKVNYVIEKISHIEVIPNIGKVEYIDFYLNSEDESAFYAISPEHLKRLRPKLDALANKFEQNEMSYGHKYAERRFFIGDNLIFNWKNEVKI